MSAVPSGHLRVWSRFRVKHPLNHGHPGTARTDSHKWHQELSARDILEAGSRHISSCLNESVRVLYKFDEWICPRSLSSTKPRDVTPKSISGLLRTGDGWSKGSWIIIGERCPTQEEEKILR